MASSKTAVRKILMLKQMGSCFYCSRRMTLDPHPELLCTVDHVIPRAEGGFDHMSNYVGACVLCNNARGTIPSALFKRYVQRFGPPRPSHMACTNRYMRIAAAHMAWNGMEPAVINDVLRIKMQEALQRRAKAG